jgi:hypothetical protein
LLWMHRTHCTVLYMHTSALHASAHPHLPQRPDPVQSSDGGRHDSCIGVAWENGDSPLILQCIDARYRVGCNSIVSFLMLL